MGIFCYLPRAISTWGVVLILLLGSVSHAGMSDCWKIENLSGTSDSSAWTFGVAGPYSGDTKRDSVDKVDEEWIKKEIPNPCNATSYSFMTTFDAVSAGMFEGDTNAESTMFEFYFSAQFGMGDFLCQPTGILIDGYDAGYYGSIYSEEDGYSCNIVIEDGIDFVGPHTIEFVFNLQELRDGWEQDEHLFPSFLALSIIFTDAVVLADDQRAFATPEPAGMLLLGCACVFLPFRRRLRALLP